MIDVVITSFNLKNRMRFLEPAVRSVLNQTLGDQIKLWLVDDGSTDGTQRELLKLKKKYGKKINLVLAKINKGKFELLNDFIPKYIEGKYFFLLDSDDALMPRAVERMYEKILSSPKLNIVRSGLYLWTKNKIKFQSIVATHPALYKYYLHHFGAFTGNTGCVWRKSVFLKTIQSYRKNLKRYQSLAKTHWEDAVRLYLIPESDRNFDAVNEPLLIYRQHASQYTSDTKSKDHESEFYRLFRKNLKPNDLLIPWKLFKQKAVFWEMNIHTLNHVLCNIFWLSTKKRAALFKKEIVKLFFLSVKKPMLLIMVPFVLFLAMKQNPPRPYYFKYNQLKWWWPKTLSTDRFLSWPVRREIERYLGVLEHVR